MSLLSVCRFGIFDYWIWVYYLLIFKYLYEVLLEIEFGYLKGVIWYNNLDLNSIKFLFFVGKVYLWINVIVMILFVVGYCVLFYIVLRFKIKNI